MDEGSLSLLVVGDRFARAFPLPNEGEVVIGRDGEIAIPHRSVSRRHARLRLGATPSIEDLGSLNGTAVDGTRLKPGERAPIAPGRLVRIGELAVLVQTGRGEEPPKGDTTPGLERPAFLPSALTPAIVVESEPMRRLYQVVDRVAPGRITVLLQGETGVGKQVVAQAIHASSPRRAAPFLGLSCVAIPDALLEAELFGYEKGAFTGADRAKPGLLENAEGGTVFLDEIGEVPLSVQAKLLRVLEERQVHRLGSLQPISIDVRFVTATNRDLEVEVAHGRFRKDLYFRLSGVVIRVPPLRERVPEIQPLARHFVRVLCDQLGRVTVPELRPEALAELERYRWPGNIRELRNVIERAVLLGTEGYIGAEHLALGAMAGNPLTPPQGTPTNPRQGIEDTAELKMRSSRDEPELARIRSALEACNGNQTRAAKLLGMSRTTLVAKLDYYGLPRPRKQVHPDRLAADD